MRKLTGFVTALVCVLALTGCVNRTVDLDLPFEASMVDNIEMYHYESPSEAEKKVITGPGDIEDIYRFFEGISLKNKVMSPPSSGSVTSFRFKLSDGTSFEVLYTAAAVKSGSVITTDMEKALFTSANIEANWDRYDYEAVPAEESELPLNIGS